MIYHNWHRLSIKRQKLQNLHQSIVHAWSKSRSDIACCWTSFQVNGWRLSWKWKARSVCSQLSQGRSTMHLTPRGLRNVIYGYPRSPTQATGSALRLTSESPWFGGIIHRWLRRRRIHWVCIEYPTGQQTCICKRDATALAGTGSRSTMHCGSGIFANNKHGSAQLGGWREEELNASWETAIKANICRKVRLYAINLDKNKYWKQIQWEWALNNERNRLEPGLEGIVVCFFCFLGGMVNY